MKFTADANAITAKGLFRKIEITYPEIQSIREEQTLTTITLKSGKVYKRNAYVNLTEEFPVIFEGIERYNIEFVDTAEESYCETPYTMEDIRSIYRNMESHLSAAANALIAEKMGTEYSVRLETRETVQMLALHLVLLKNGSVVNVPDVAKETLSPEMPESIEMFPIGLIYKWDTSYRYGMYSLQPEFEDMTEAEKNIADSLVDFADYYIKED
jgi:hypothetical protein